ncbi:hypothetical protein ABZ646_04615 [Streptomyces sp. NPDC007162]|uniref:hypothetical protein n=1 Tax=Streptomyces sp. NPDC007162 TaxID=3156917 RepID=UPI0033CEA5D4
MHRTTTTAALLVTVTVSALSGCVTVQRPAVPGPPPGTAPSLPSVPRPDGSTEPKVVQAPAKEALEMVGPRRTHGRPPSAAPHDAPTPPAPPHHRTPLPHAATGHPRSPSQPHPHRTRSPHVDIPDVTRSAPKAPDVCALGKQYGGWRADSPQAKICEQTYGR